MVLRGGPAGDWDGLSGRSQARLRPLKVLSSNPARLCQARGSWDCWGPKGAYSGRGHQASSAHSPKVWKEGDAGLCWRTVSILGPRCGQSRLRRASKMGQKWVLSLRVKPEVGSGADSLACKCAGADISQAWVGAPLWPLQSYQRDFAQKVKPP